MRLKRAPIKPRRKETRGMCWKLIYDSFESVSCSQGISLKLSKTEGKTASGKYMRKISSCFMSLHVMEIFTRGVCLNISLTEGKSCHVHIWLCWCNVWLCEWILPILFNFYCLHFHVHYHRWCKWNTTSMPWHENYVETYRKMNSLRRDKNGNSW